MADAKKEKVLLDWCASDVLDTVQDYTGLTLSKEDAVKVANRIVINADSTTSIGWEVITSCVDKMIAEGLIELIPIAKEL